MQEIKVKPWYKMTELGVIPDDWEVKDISDIADVVGWWTPSTTNSSFWNWNIDWFTPTEIWEKKYSFSSVRKITDEWLQSSSAKILPKGTILLTSRAWIWDISILWKEACTNQWFQSLVPKLNTSSEFLYYLTWTLKSELLKNASWSTFLEISPLHVKRIKVIYPSYKEQNNIAKSLSDIDNLIFSIDKLIKKKKQIKEWSIKELLTWKRILNWFTWKWETVKLRALVDAYKWSWLSKEKLTENWTNECILYWELFTTYDRVISKVLNKTDYNEWTLSKKDDILLPWSTTTTWIDLATSSAIFKDNILLWWDINILRRKSKKYHSLFLSYYLTNIDRDKIAELAQWTTIIHLYWKDLLWLDIRIPLDYDYQSSVVKVLSDMDSEIENIEIKRSKYKQIKEWMMQELLTWKTRLV